MCGLDVGTGIRSFGYCFIIGYHLVQIVDHAHHDELVHVPVLNLHNS